jgi:hypothetical protein
MNAVPVILLVAAAIVLSGCEGPDASQERERRADYVRPCQDFSVLLSTRAGSPSRARCPNQLHRMEVQVATHPTHRESAALVFCRCQTGGEKEPAR